MSKGKPKHIINEKIRFSEVRLIHDGENRIMRTEDAIEIAYSIDKDLIIINPNQAPPITKIEDYKKFLYTIEKKEKESQKKCDKSFMKEIKLSSEIAENDMNTKANKAIEILEKGGKIKCILQIKGRQNVERGKITMLKFAELIEEHGIPESMPQLANNKWIMLIKPKK
jgi:translation initiation factor IF-3